MRVPETDLDDNPRVCLQLFNHLNLSFLTRPSTGFSPSLFYVQNVIVTCLVTCVLLLVFTDCVRRTSKQVAAARSTRHLRKARNAKACARLGWALVWLSTTVAFMPVCTVLLSPFKCRLAVASATDAVGVDASGSGSGSGSGSSIGAGIGSAVGSAVGDILGSGSGSGSDSGTGVGGESVLAAAPQLSCSSADRYVEPSPAHMLAVRSC